jgi:hypothetical protein
MLSSTPAGKAVVKNVRVNPWVYAGFLVIACIADVVEDAVEIREYCLDEYEKCMGAGGPWTWNDRGSSMCEKCRIQCIRDKYWHCPVDL